MSGPPRRSLKRDGSVSSLEHSISTLAEPQSEPITIYPGPGAQGAIMSKIDLEIVNRLQQLRSTDKENLPTEDEVSTRLAALKGLPADYYKRKNNIAYQPPTQQSATQQVDNLLSQFSSEAAIDAKRPKPEDEIEARLARLRGIEPKPSREVGGACSAGATSYSVPSGAFINTDLGDEVQDIDMQEVEKLMFDATKAENLAAQSMKELKSDPEIAKLLASVSKKKDKEKYSDDSDVPDAKISLEDFTNDEVQNIVNMYQKKGEKRKLRKKLKKNKKMDDDSDSELSSSENKSSDSEKLSHSDYTDSD